MANLDAVISRDGFPFTLRHYASAGARLLGHGEKAIEQLLTEGLTLRPATMNDAERLFAWRNDPDTRANSITTDEVPWDNHVAWLQSSLAKPERKLLVAEVGGTPVGTVRIDHGKEMSWTVAPEARGKGYAKTMVVAAAVPGAVAEIKRANIASQKVAEAAGFRLVEDGELQRWER